MNRAAAALVAFALALATRAADARCASDTDCTTAPLLHCDTSTAAPVCVMCLADDQCAGGRRCERDRTRASYAQCVDCTLSHTEACSADRAGARCLAAGGCGCVTDDDCGPSGRVCEAASCRAGCRGDGSRGCADGERCSAAGALAGTCVRVPPPPAATTTTEDAGSPPADPAPLPLASGGGCAVAAVTPDAPLALAVAAGLFVVARRRRSTRALGALAALAFTTVGCGHAPSPLRPGYEGSVGLPHRGVLVGGARVDEDPSLHFLRNNDRRYATPRFARVITRAARAVAGERAGSVLVVGDLSARTGGTLLPHLSHRSGRDADLLLYVTTLDGAPVVSPGFVHVREDGLAWDEARKRFLRVDVERQWLLLRALLTDDEGEIQFVFCSRTLRSMLVSWAVARGEPTELVYRALTVLVQPQPGGEHDDHFHVRTACTPDEQFLGCEPSGPMRPWLARRGTAKEEDPRALAAALFAPPSVAAEDAP